MKKTKYLTILIMFFCLISGIKITNAETTTLKKVDASIKLIGRNTFGRKLKIEVDCKDAGGYSCMISDIKWYYNDTNSLEGGTEIKGSSERGGTGYSNYLIEKNLVGKYIYVVATISSYDDDYESIVVSDITDDTTNVSSTVGEYITYIDSSKYSINSTATFEVGADLELKINGLEEDKENVYIYLSNGEKPNIIQTENGCEIDYDQDDYTKFKSVNDLSKVINVSDDWYLLKGYDKAYIYKEYYDDANYGIYCEVTEEPINIKKPSIPDLGNRYQFYLFTNEYKELSTFQLFPFRGITGSHELITKIGIINDEDLLKKLAKNTDDSLELLLEYAKKK